MPSFIMTLILGKKYSADKENSYYWSLTDIDIDVNGYKINQWKIIQGVPQ